MSKKWSSAYLLEPKRNIGNQEQNSQTAGQTDLEIRKKCKTMQHNSQTVVGQTNLETRTQRRKFKNTLDGVTLAESSTEPLATEVKTSKFKRARLSKNHDKDKMQDLLSVPSRRRGSKSALKLSREQVSCSSKSISESKTSASGKSKGTSSAEHIYNTLRDYLEKLRNEAKAAAMSKYMRNKFQFLGISTPQCRAAFVDLWKDVKKLSSHDLRALAKQAWNSPEREFHYFAVGLLEREKFNLYADDGLSSSDAAHHALDFIKTFIEHDQSWWDTLDNIASNVVGPLVYQYRDDLLPEMDKWNQSANLWLCRTSILYQLKYKKDTDRDRLFRYCLNRAHEKEFFIRKAIGWALREYHKTDHKAVSSFVQKNKDKLSALSVKEALKHDK